MLRRILDYILFYDQFKILITLGMDKDKGSNLISLLGLVDTVTGVVVGIIGDTNVISKVSILILKPKDKKRVSI